MADKTSHLGYVKADNIVKELTDIMDGIGDEWCEENTKSELLGLIKKLTPPKNITHISTVKCDGKLWTPLDALISAIDEIGNRGAFKEGKKLLVLTVDQQSGYEVSFVQAGMTMSECLTLCEVSKMVFS